MEIVFTVKDEISQIPFNVRIVGVGEKYGLNGVLTNDSDQPLVEFYDTRHTDRDPTTKHLGQFTGARYFVETLLESSNNDCGLCLHGGVPSWALSAATYQEVKTVLRVLYKNM